MLTRFKIQDDFKKVLLDEAKKTEQDFSDRLAGHNKTKERGYSDKQPYNYTLSISVSWYLRWHFKDIKTKNTNTNQSML